MTWNAWNSWSDWKGETPEIFQENESPGIQICFRTSKFHEVSYSEPSLFVGIARLYQIVGRMMSYDVLCWFHIVSFLWFCDSWVSLDSSAPASGSAMTQYSPGVGLWDNGTMASLQRHPWNHLFTGPEQERERESARDHFEILTLLKWHDSFRANHASLVHLVTFYNCPIRKWMFSPRPPSWYWRQEAQSQMIARLHKVCA